MTENLTERLADFVVATRLEDLADSARERARIVLADTVASALMGSRSEEVPLIERLASAVAGPGRSPVVGRPPLANAGAVLVNGYLVTATTVCDVYRPALCHVSPQVFPPALATGIERDVTGADFLLAFALGLEITTRVALGSNYPAFRARGWHSPGVWGPFGGAAAAGTLLGLDARHMRNAFSLAGSQSAGTFAHWGTPTIKFHQSRGALSGYLAANLAETGFEAGADVLTAEDGGLYGTYSDGGNPGVTLDGLGDRWELERLSLRPWPLASSLQSVATALLHLVETEGASAASVARARVGLSPTVYHSTVGFRGTTVSRRCCPRPLSARSSSRTGPAGSTSSPRSASGRGTGPLRAGERQRGAGRHRRRHRRGRRARADGRPAPHRPAGRAARRRAGSAEHGRRQVEVPGRCRGHVPTRWPPGRSAAWSGSTSCPPSTRRWSVPWPGPQPDA